MHAKEKYLEWTESIPVCLLWNVRVRLHYDSCTHTITQSSVCACSTVDRPTSQPKNVFLFAPRFRSTFLHCEPKQFGFISFAIHFDIFQCSFYGRCSFSSLSLDVSSCMVVAKMRWNYHNLTIGIHGIIFILRSSARSPLSSSVASTFSQSEALYFHWSPGITKNPNNNNTDWMMQSEYWNGLEPLSNKYTTKWNET